MKQRKALFNNTPQIQRLKVLIAGICSLILCMGIARFAYTPLLPLMMSQAGLSHENGGWLAAINYAGYLIGVVLASQVSDAKLKHRIYRWGMVLAVLTNLLMALSNHLYVWALSRFVAGLSTSAGLMIGSGLILNWLMRHQYKDELGIHFSGIGLGIVLSACAVMWMKPHWDWAQQWQVFALLAGLLLWPALAWFPPAQSQQAQHEPAHMQHSPPSPTFMRLFLAAYACAGFGYVITATFIVAIVNDTAGLAQLGFENVGEGVFLLIGLLAAPSCYVWDKVARKIGDVNALVLASVMEMAGIIAPTLGLGLAGALIGAILYGATTIAIVSLVLTMAGRYYPAQPAKMMSKMTICYGIAQIVGPALTGWLAKHGGGYVQGLYLATAFMGIASVLFLAMKISTRAS